MTPPTPRRTAVVALGGHAFILPGQRGTEQEQAENAARIAPALLALLERGYELVVTHGNGPQVGALLLQNETEAVPRAPLDVLVAETQGSLGYYLQRSLADELARRGHDREVVTLVTEVVVDPEDPAFLRPTKPVGPVLSAAEAERRVRDHGWVVRDDPGRGPRRVVASPEPKRVLQARIVREAVRSGHVVIACGGGGIPVARGPAGTTVGIEAVIDKDLTSSMLASEIEAELFVILTAVDAVMLDFAKPSARPLAAVTTREARAHLAAGQFPEGSMGPKILSILRFIERGGRRAIVTSAEKLEHALDGEAGTHFVGRI